MYKKTFIKNYIKKREHFNAPTLNVFTTENNPYCELLKICFAKLRKNFYYLK